MLTLIAALMAVLSGWVVLARTASNTFPCGIKPYLELDRNAITYAVLTVSNVLAGAHLLMVIELVLRAEPLGVWNLTASILTLGLHVWIGKGA